MTTRTFQNTFPELGFKKMEEVSHWKYLWLNFAMTQAAPQIV